METPVAESYLGGLPRIPNEPRSQRIWIIPNGWVVRILSSVGNYGDLYERNLGDGSPLKLDRGQNRLWTQGGLMYAPPAR